MLVTDIEGRHPKTGHEGPKVESKPNTLLSLTSALDGVGDQHHAPANLPPVTAGSHCTGGWVGTRTGLDGCGTSAPHRDYDIKSLREKDYYEWH